jgi:hypothetical protein
VCRNGLLQKAVEIRAIAGDERTTGLGLHNETEKEQDDAIFALYEEL